MTVGESASILRRSDRAYNTVGLAARASEVANENLPTCVPAGPSTPASPICARDSGMGATIAAILISRARATNGPSLPAISESSQLGRAAPTLAMMSSRLRSAPPQTPDVFRYRIFIRRQRLAPSQCAWDLGAAAAALSLRPNSASESLYWRLSGASCAALR